MMLPYHNDTIMWGIEELMLVQRFHNKVYSYM